MKKRRLRRWGPTVVAALEGRTLLAAAAPTATWIGQDGHDLVGPYATPGPDDVQDVHIALSGLPTDRSIVQANIVGDHSGQWMYGGPPNGPWAAALVRSPGSSDADLYVEPYQVETGRTFNIVLTYSDRSTAFLTMQGGAADPNLRMPGAAVNARWLGQDGHDWTGPGAAVGPDGFQDAHIALTQLSATVAIQSATLTASGGGSWAFGPDPGLLPDVELIQGPGDPTQGDLYFSPQGDLDGQTLTLTIRYANGKTDTATVAAGATDPHLAMPAPAPVSVVQDAFSVRWAGQDGLDLTGAGDVHLVLSGLPAGRAVVAAQLSDGTLNTWDYTTPGVSLNDPNVNAMRLGFRPSASDPGGADVGFAPLRDESRATMTLRLVLDDGTNLIATFDGGAADFSRRAPQPAASSVDAHPGDDLNALANQYGTIHLTAGTYNLAAPLVLNQPLTIDADPGTTLLFSQGPSDPTWTAAIKIKAGNTSLSGFAVRFAGPIRWTDGISYGPAVIGTTDNFDAGSGQPLVNIRLTSLDLQAPPSASAWEGAPSLIRVVSAQSGVIANNILKGGTTEFIGGPWQIVGNDYQGTVPGTYTATAFAGHFTHDVTIDDNRAEPVGPSGKTYRFLVLTQSGTGDVVEGNTVVGIGPQDSDTQPNPNATEVVLTEAYYVQYEGAPLSISPDGRVVKISGVLSGWVQAGDVLSILAGAQAGQWRLISQALTPNTFLLDRPIDPDTAAISISLGFVNETFRGNTIDTRGSSTAQGLVLAGNQFGVQVVDNTFVGGARAFFIAASPSETPSIWGWTHAPVLGATISGNVIEDSIEGGLLVVDHNPASRSDVGRVYLSASLTDNAGIWTDSFLSQAGPSIPGGQPSALTIGMPVSNDPGELLVDVAGNQVIGPAAVINGPTLNVVAAVVNGQALTGQGIVLPPFAIDAPSGLALADDTGVSAIDGQTSDPTLRFNPVAMAAGYEYSLTGAEGSYLPLGSPDGFLPQGLVAGFNAVYVRAYDARGDRGPVALILFAYVPPGSIDATSPTPPTARTVRYLYRMTSGADYVPLGTSLILSRAEIASGSVGLQIRLVNDDGTTSPLTTDPPSGTASSDPSSSPPDDSSGGPSSGSGSAAGGGTPPSPDPGPPSTTQLGPALGTEILAHPAFLINRAIGGRRPSRAALARARASHGAAWNRHPHPFMMRPARSQRLHGHGAGHGDAQPPARPHPHPRIGAAVSGRAAHRGPSRRPGA